MTKVSVIMGIFNCQDTLPEAIESIIHQTYRNWELIMCDDGSTDRTYEVAREYALKYPEIHVLRNKENRGLNITLNRCLRKARGEYIARMDGDDVCAPDRFEKQVDYLDQHPETAIVSSWMTLFDSSGEWGVQKAPLFPSAEQVVSGNPILHAPSMMRAEAIREVGGYTVDVRMLRVEDVNLWIKLYSKGYRAYNIQEPLYGMRNDQKALNRRKYIYRINSTFVRLMGCRALHLGPVYYLKSFKPMVNGLVPGFIRRGIRGLQRKI